MRFSLLLLAAFLSLGFSTSPRDRIDETSVFVGEKIDSSSEHFLIVVDHLEEDFEGSSVKAARDIRVSLKFDVSLDAQVSLNGKVVPHGYSELKIATQIFQVEKGEHIPFPALQQVSVRVFVAVETSLSPEGFSFSKVIIQERVTGIEDSEVWQAEVLQKTFVIQHDGKILNGGVTKVSIVQGENPNFQGPASNANEGDEGDQEDFPIISDEAPPHRKHECSFSKLWAKGKEWFGGLSLPLQIVVAFGAGASLALSLSLLLSFLKCLKCLCCGKSCKRTADPKSNSERFKANLKVYSVQYTSLDSEEKDQKKAKQGNPIEMA